MKLKSYLMAAAAVSLLLSVISCEDDGLATQQPQVPPTVNTGDGIEDPASPTYSPGDGYTERYRPLVHYTPARNWLNDPNGMVYIDGVYHLYYQYNPYGNNWGNMSWGHASSRDLIKWEEHHVVLRPDHLGDIFSGSAVCDKDNTAGFGENALVALYTSNGSSQQQSLAYSLDGGMNFIKYGSNPVMPNTSEPDCRDPKVFWHEGTRRWIMVLSLGWKREVDIWASENLKNWYHLSRFGYPLDANLSRGQWECPDLIPLDYKGTEKWAMIVSVNAGPHLGSGCMYFIGNFDGTRFTADGAPLYLDYGMDNYAGVTWSNAPENRKIFIGWMNNWDYTSAVPTYPWRSAMTLPRELKLIEYQGKPLLANTVVKEIETIAGDWKDVTSGSLGVEGPYHLQLEVDITRDGSVSLFNDVGECYEMELSASAQVLVSKRTGATGLASFSPNFSVPSLTAPYNTEGDTMTLDIYVDQSSVEIFTSDGSMCQTNLVFPRSIYNNLDISESILTVRVRPLSNIWR